MSKTTFTVKREELKIIMERIFDAPRELVWKAYTDPTLIPKWWGPRDSTTTVDKIDLRPGGVWRFINHGADGNDYPFNGVYKEITPPERLVYTFEWEAMPGHVLTETIILEEQEGPPSSQLGGTSEGQRKTKLTDIAHYKNIEDLEGMIASGMEKGATESVDRLAELVEKA